MANFDRINTAKIQFKHGQGIKQPTEKEMISFIVQLNVKKENVHTLYKDLNQNCIYIKFHEEKYMDEFLEEYSTENEKEFVYENGDKTTVEICHAKDKFKYVRIFNLPPEIEDKSIAEALTRYGSVKSLNREKYGASLGFEVFSGVRGVFIEMKQEIPNFIYINRIKAKIYYPGVKETCNYCKAEDHKKINCPNQKPQEREQKSYSDIMTNTKVTDNQYKTPDQKKETTNKIKNINKMTNLNTFLSSKVTVEKRKNETTLSSEEDITEIQLSSDEENTYNHKIKTKKLDYQTDLTLDDIEIGTSQKTISENSENMHIN